MRGLVLLVALAACSRSSSSSPSASPPPSSSAPTPVLDAAGPTPSASAAAPTCTAPLASRTAEAQTLYGASVRLATVDGTFLFVDPDHTPLFTESVELAPKVLSALRHDRIAPRPLCPVSVYLFASVERLRAFSAPRGYTPESGRNLGVYDRARGIIVTDLSGGRAYVPTTAHELAHVLMDADAPEAPRWFRECVTSLYESPVLAAGDEIHGTDDWRYEQLRAAVTARNPEAHLGALFGMSDDDFRARSVAGTDGTKFLLHSAMARATCQWLDGQGMLWPVYRAWRDGFAGDRDGLVAFTHVTGRAPTAPEAEAAWRTWVLHTR
jgi:hypothetical protein